MGVVLGLSAILGLALVERDGFGGTVTSVGDNAFDRVGRELFATLGALAENAGSAADEDAPSDGAASVDGEDPSRPTSSSKDGGRPSGSVLGWTADDERAWYLANVEAWIDDLRDDGERSNAFWARRQLRKDVPDFTPALLAALRSDDKQQRHYAAHLLIERGHEPTADLIEVMVDDLRDDDLFERNAQDAVLWLDDHLDVARHRLGSALLSSDVQQRFSAAYLLARGGYADTRTAACAILIGHLADNDLPHDAELAREALTQLSYLALPQVLAALRTSTDRQALAYLDRIQMDVVRRAADPASSRPEVLGTNSYLPYRWIGWSGN